MTPTPLPEQGMTPIKSEDELDNDTVLMHKIDEILYGERMNELRGNGEEK